MKKQNLVTWLVDIFSFPEILLFFSFRSLVNIVIIRRSSSLMTTPVIVVNAIG
jgi:hypothetical protein